MTGLDRIWAINAGLRQRFPHGNHPFQIMTRLLEECGELAEQVNHFEDVGIKRQKHGDPEKAKMAKEVQDVIRCALQIAYHYGIEEELSQSITHSYNKLMHPIFRTISSKDHSFLAEIIYHAIFVPEGAEPPALDVVQSFGLRKYYEDFGRAGDLGFIAIDPATNHRMAAAWLRSLTAELPGYGYVDDQTPELTIATLPEYRGKGIGTRLLEHLFEAAKAHYSAISLSVWPANPAYRLYQRLGFVVVKENEHDVVMVKQLS
ncbi:MAG: GNAT family N-acetyltransferase [Caldilineaceae bacterium]